MKERRATRAIGDVRGGSFVEYLILLGVVALAALAGVRAFGRTTRAQVIAAAECADTLRAACAGTSPSPDVASGSIASAVPTGLAQSASTTASRSRNPRYWITRPAAGFGSHAWNGAKHFGELVIAATGPGLLYSAFTGKPNTAIETVKGLAKIATSPRLARQTARYMASQIRASWQRDPGYTLGAGVFEAASMFVPIGPVKTAGTVAEVVEGASDVAKVAEAARAAQAAERIAAEADVADAAARYGHAASAAARDAASEAARFDPQSADLYRRLGVGRDASAAEIKTQYRKFAAMRHPDKVADSEKAAATSDFQSVREAYEVLSNAEKRAAYDGANASAVSVAAKASKPTTVENARNAYADAIARLGDAGHVSASPEKWVAAAEARRAYGMALESEFLAAQSGSDPVARFVRLQGVYAKATERIGKGVVEDSYANLEVARSVYRAVERMAPSLENPGTRFPPGAEQFLGRHRGIMHSPPY